MSTNVTTLRIKVLGDPVLRKQAQAVKRITDTHRQILSQMARLMYDAQGIGLAAPQVGISQAIIVADIGSGLYKLVNPRIVKKSGSQAIEEGCLSVPGICLKIKRAKRIVVEAQDEFANSLVIEAEDLLATVFQHEIDHLKGKMIVDYASLWDKPKIKKKLKELKRVSDAEELCESKTKSCKLQL